MGPFGSYHGCSRLCELCSSSPPASVRCAGPLIELMFSSVFQTPQACAGPRWLHICTYLFQDCLSINLVFCVNKKKKHIYYLLSCGTVGREGTHARLRYHL